MTRERNPHRQGPANAAGPLSFGSAGGQHISAIAAELGIREILIPHLPGAFSAFGLICSDLKFDSTRPVVRTLDALTDETLTELFVTLEKQGLELFEAQGIDFVDDIISRSAWAPRNSASSTPW